MMNEQEKLDAALAGAVKTSAASMTWTRSPVPCKCGRIPRINPETRKLSKHRVGKNHPGFKDMNREKRKEMWCPEVVE